MAQKAANTERQSETAERMIVSGLVLIEGTEKGIPGLSVDILHHGSSLMRLGSTVTDPNGKFSVTTSVHPIKTPTTQNLNIQLVILTPERSGYVRTDRIIFESEVRENAALNEVFLVEIASYILTSKGLKRAVDEARPLVERRTEALLENARVTEIVSNTATKLAVAEIKKVEKQRRFFNDVVAPSVRKEISNVTENERKTLHFVREDEMIQITSRRVQHNELIKLRDKEENDTESAARKVRRRTRLQLSTVVLDRLKDILDDNIATITQDQLEAALGTSLDKPALIQRSITFSDPCREKLSGENCLSTGENDTPGLENDPVTSDVNGQNVAFDAGTAIAQLMKTQTTPEQTVMFGDIDAQLEGRLNASDVATAIGGITLQPGPADVPSFHDFTTLQLAFEPVWQEALDDRILDDVEAAYDRIVESGLDTSDGNTWDLPFITTMYTAYVFTIKEVPQVIASHVRISLEEYRALPVTTRTRLSTLATDIEAKRDELIEALAPRKQPEKRNSSGGSWWRTPLNVLGEAVDLALLPHDLLTDLALGKPAISPQFDTTAISLIEQIRILEAEADRIVSHARQIIIDKERDKPFRPTHEIIQSLRSARTSGEPYRYFAASRSQRSVNFGLMVTYRQRWTPISYQVGDLVSTIPLGPKETRKYSKKEIQKRRRSEKELESNLSNSKFDSETKSRAESEIIAKASGKTSFEHNAKGSFNYGVEGGISAGGESISTFRVDAERHSQDTKKNMRESVVKAAEERKRETKLEVELEESFESEFTQSGELMNPNDEIPVTFLLYELQRRYRINEKLHQLQAVVLVAQEMPFASQIDAVWIIQHDWILNRVLLDDSFRPALMYVSTTLVSERETLSHMSRAILDQQSLVEKIKEDLADRRSMEGLRYAALERQIERMARSNGNEGDIWDTVSDVVSGGGLLSGILGGGDEGEDNAAKIRESAARDAWDRERQEADTFRNRLVDAQSTLASMREEFHNRLSAHLGQVTQVERLATHIYQNIMYYMQAIWSHEPDDQRFLRLKDVPVPTLEAQHNFRISDALLPELDPDFFVGFDTEYGTATIPAQPENIPTAPLAQVADLSNPLGFMGNYMIFPMYESNALTDFMMAPYVEYAAGEYNISDPDIAGNMSLEEFGDYVCCLKDELPTERFEVVKPELNKRLKKLLQQSIRDNEEIIVGSGNLYIECLAGAHSIMEQFKHLHRQIDVKTAQEELRTQAIDNVRRAQRILDSNLEDPDIEAKYVFEGGGSATVVPPGPDTDDD